MFKQIITFQFLRRFLKRCFIYFRLKFNEPSDSEEDENVKRLRQRRRQSLIRKAHISILLR